MTKKITIEEALKLVSFDYIEPFGWCVMHVNGNACGNVYGDVLGDVEGDVLGNVKGNVLGTINDKEWHYIEES